MLNRNPSAAELFAATRSKVDENGHRIWYDGHAKSVYVSCPPIRSKYVNIVNMHACIYTYISDDMCIYTYINVYIRVWDVWMYICIYTYPYVYTRIYACTYTYICVCDV